MIPVEPIFSSLTEGIDTLFDKKCFFIVDSALQALLPKLRDKAAHIIILEGGEQVKTREKKAWLEDELLRMGCDSESTLVAVGGGTILDLVGFVAATLFRGIRFISCPSTLLAMVDAAVGGKNGVNVGGIKNVVGTIYHPKKIVIDVTLLDTLSDDEIENGLVEMMKHALLESPERFSLFEEAITKIKQKERSSLQREIAANIAFKNHIVKQSQACPKVRDLLNFGHTVGHALEALEKGEIAHGKAVALGMIAECKLSHFLGKMKECEYQTIERAIKQQITLPKLSRIYSYDEWMRALLFDKKKTESQVCSVLLERIGVPYIEAQQYAHPVKKDDWEPLFDWISKNF